MQAALPALVLAVLFTILGFGATAQAQRSSTTSGAATPTVTPTPGNASTPAIRLADFVPSRASLALNATTGIFFTLDIPANTTTITTTAADGSQVTERAAPTRLSVSLSLCSGPAIPPYDLNNATLVKELSQAHSAAQLRQRTLVRAYWTSSDDALGAQAIPAAGSGTGSSSSGGTDVDPTLYADAIAPGPNAQTSSGIKGTYLGGGAALIQLTVDRDRDNVFTLGLWPPEDVRGIDDGVWSVRVIASMQVTPELVSSLAGVSLDDTDQSHALVTSEEYSTVSPLDPNARITPNVTLFVLPSTGFSALDSYFNSSLCALETSFSLFNGTWDAPGQKALAGHVLYNITETKRGIVDTAVSSRVSASVSATRVRMAVMINNLVPATNYTAWLRWTRPPSSASLAASGVSGTVLYPAIKFVTKASANCRLVTDLNFCPSVAYSIPIGPEVSTDVALAAANLTIAPNMANFTRTIDTFPCGSSYFGQYSFVSTCDDCKNAYRDWLCAVVLPRCTDPVADPSAQSAASQDGVGLTGAPSGTNTRLLPYIVNRNARSTSNTTTSPSRQPYVDAVLQPGTYGELLPCIYTCHFVSRACPPIAGWTWSCPTWDISAQRDYGTFVDAGPGGVGADLNGGDGSGRGDTGVGVGRNATAVGGGKGRNSTSSNRPSGQGDDNSGPNVSGDPDNGGTVPNADDSSNPGGAGAGSNPNSLGGGIFFSQGDALAKGAGQRWGGISRYVATDAFGHQYCNALGVDLVLRQQNAGRRRVQLGTGGGGGTVTGAVLRVAAALAVLLIVYT